MTFGTAGFAAAAVGCARSRRADQWAAGGVTWCRDIAPADDAQPPTGYELALLVTFGTARERWKRVAFRPWQQY